MKVFAINGVSLSGKDTFCNNVRIQKAIKESHEATLEQKIRYNGNKVKVISTIDPVKEVYENFFGWKGDKTPEHRKNLNSLKLIWISVSNGPSNWLRNMLEEFDHYSKVDIVFVMVREFDEMMTAIEIGKEVCDHAETIQLVRHGIPIPPVEQEFLDSHPADYTYDWTIINPTTDDPSIPKLNKAASEFFDLITKIRMHGVKYNPVVWNPVDEKFVEWISK